MDIVLNSMVFLSTQDVTVIIYGDDTQNILTYSFSDRDFTNGTTVRKTHFTGLLIRIRSHNADNVS